MDAKKKKLALIGGGVVAAGFVYYSYRSNAVSSNAASATDTTSTDGTIPYGSGDPYGSGYYADGGYSPTPGSNWPPNPTPPPPPAHVPETNAQWAGQALQFLRSQGYNRTTVGAALTKYLAKQGLSANEYVIVEQAIAFIGYPPQNPGEPKHAAHGGRGNPPPKKHDHVPPKLEHRYFREIPSNQIWHVTGGKRYLVTRKTWNAFKRKPKTTVIVASSPVMHIPFGGKI